MKSPRPTQAKRSRKFSDAVIAKRYFDLQRLRDEVHKAETSALPCSMLNERSERHVMRTKNARRRKCAEPT
jgi:hypothetical protein